MGMYHRQQVKLPTDKKEERNIIARTNVENGSKTSKGEKRALLGTSKKSTPKGAVKAKPAPKSKAKK